MSTPDRWMRVLLWLYPPTFRGRFGREMRATFADTFRDRTSPGERIALLTFSIIDAVRSAGAEWRASFRSLRPLRLMIADWHHSLARAARVMRRNPGFSAATILTLAVGIGATTAVFSVISASLLTPLPYPNAARLVAVAETRKADEISVSYPDLLDLQSRSRVFDAIGGFTGRTFTLTGAVDPERVRGQVITANLFSTLGVHPILGHDFAATDDAANAARVVAISHALWTTRFGGDSAVIGRSIVLDGEPFTIIAVMPPGFRFPDGIVYGPADAWVPMSQLGNSDRVTRGDHPGIEGVGLLKRGVSVRQGAVDMARVSAALATEYAPSNHDIGVVVRDAVDEIVGSLKNALVLLFGAAAVVLLIACANVAGLLLTRADSRRRELAINVALGATRARVAINLAGEAAVLAIGGGLAGIALAFGLVRVFGGYVADLPRLDALSVDVRALGFAAFTTILVALVCGLAPAFALPSTDTHRSLQIRGATSPATAKLRNAFVVAQVALSLVLLVTASLLVRTFQRMSATDGGIRADGVMTFTLVLPDARYGGGNARGDFAGTLAERLATRPGVSGGAVISLLPFSGGGAQSGIGPAGGTHEQELRADVAAVTPDYFHVMGIDVVRGRPFTTADGAQDAPVAIVDERFATAMWPGENPIGQRISGWSRPEWTVVGVVRHVKNYGVAAESRQEMYTPFAQRPSSRVWAVVRSTAQPAGLFAAARATVKEMDPLLPVYLTRTMRDVVDATVAGPRLAAFLSAGYALTALLVVIIGIHGAISYIVLRRTREIGVRVALGATAPRVLRLVVQQSLRLTGLGVVIGIAGALAVSQLMRGQLFGVAPTDLATFAAATAAMLVAGVVASAIPAWRALRVSPLLALSDE